MATITEDYVSFEIAKLLKEKGFQAKCTACYRSDLNNAFELISGRINYCNPRFSKCKSIPPYNAPTLQMAMKWLREEHNIHISVYVFNRELPITDVPISYTCDIATKKLSSQQGHLRGVWQSYEQAVEAALKYCLENLI